MTQMTKLLDKNVKAVNIPIIHMFKSLKENRIKVRDVNRKVRDINKNRNRN